MPTEMMIRRLRVNSTISDEDAAALRALPSSVKQFAEGAAFVREGDRPTHCCVIMNGFAFRAKITESGKRQILSFHPAGDMPDLHGLLLERWTTTWRRYPKRGSHSSNTDTSTSCWKRGRRLLGRFGEKRS